MTDTQQQLVAVGETLPAVQPQTPMEMIQALSAAGGDVAVIEKLMDLQERWEASEAAKAFHASLSQFQADCPMIEKGREVSFGGRVVYKFAAYEDIMRIIQPLLTKHGLSVSFSSRFEGGLITADCHVSKGGHEIVRSNTGPVPSDMKVNDTQKAGAAKSYAKRYALQDALNIVVCDEDSDGNGLDSSPVNDEQMDAIVDLLGMLDDGMQRRFFQWVGVEAVRDIPAARFDDVIAKLQTKVGVK